MNIQLQKSTIIQQLEMVQDADLLKSVQKLLDFGLRHQSNSTDFEIDQQTQKMVMQRVADYYKNPTDVMDFDTMLDEMEKSI